MLAQRAQKLIVLQRFGQYSQATVFALTYKKGKERETYISFRSPASPTIHFLMKVQEKDPCENNEQARGTIRVFFCVTRSVRKDGGRP